MQVFFIQESDKKSLIKRFLKPIQVNNNIIVVNETRNKKKSEVVRKISKVLEANNSKTIILSSKLKKDKELVDFIYSYGIDIIQGKRLLKKLIKMLVNQLCKKNNIKKQDATISLTTNSADKWVMSLIEDLSKEFKFLNIVTNNINYFKSIQARILNNNGIVIMITNNKRKALIKSNIIINVDFPEELLNKYSVYDNSVIINMEENTKIHKKRFNGKIINEYEIKLKEKSNIKQELKKEEYKKFDLQDLTEIYIMNYPNEINNVIIS